MMIEVVPAAAPAPFSGFSVPSLEDSNSPRNYKNHPSHTC